MGYELVVILVLALANGLFSGAEIAVLSIRKTRLAELVEGGAAGARAVQGLRAETERFLATVQIGITVVGATAAAFGGSTLAARITPVLSSLGASERTAADLSLALVVTGVSFLTIVVGELVPKSLALRHSEGYALLLGRPMRLLAWLMRPVVWLLTASSNLVLKLFGDRTSFSEARLSPDELQQMVEEATRSGSVHPRTGDIASRAFDLAQLSVADVMVPRPRVAMVPRRATAEELKRILLEEAHSRMPVYQDRPDNVVGYVVVKDLLGLALERELVVLEDALRPAFFVPATMRALDAMQAMQQRRTLLAVVVDEVGGLAGIVTMEDLVEELVGEIVSEHGAPPEPFQRDADGSYLVPGTAPLRELNRALQIDLPEDRGATTLGGLCIAIAGTIPGPGARLIARDGSVLEVIDASPRRVKQVRLRPAPSAKH